MPELLEIITSDIIKILKSNENISNELKNELYRLINNKENVYKLYLNLNKFLYTSELIDLYESLNIDYSIYYKDA